MISFRGENRKFRMWTVKFMVRIGNEGCDIQLTNYMKILEEDAEETRYKGVTAVLKLLNRTAYNELMIA